MELRIKNQLWAKQWKYQNEFEGKNQIKNINKNNCNIIKDLRTFNFTKLTFHKTINKINGNK